MASGYIGSYSIMSLYCIVIADLCKHKLCTWLIVKDCFRLSDEIITCFTLVLEPGTWQLMAKELLYWNPSKMQTLNLDVLKCVAQQMVEMKEGSCCIYQCCWGDKHGLCVKMIKQTLMSFESCSLSQTGPRHGRALLECKRATGKQTTMWGEWKHRWTGMRYRDHWTRGQQGDLRDKELKYHPMNALPEKISFQLKLLPAQRSIPMIAKAMELLLIYTSTQSPEIHLQRSDTLP